MSILLYKKTVGLVHQICRYLKLRDQKLLGEKGCIIY